MWTAFLWENFHFAANFFAALVFFAMFWLYFDAWLPKKTWPEIPKLAGIGLLSLSFVIGATILETKIFTATLIPVAWQDLLFWGTRVGGYLFLAIGTWLDPLQSAPKTRGLANTPLILALGTVSSIWLPILAPVLATLVAWIYLRRTTVGLEKHLGPVTLALFILAVSELLLMPRLFYQTTNVGLAQVIAPFGAVWITQRLVMLLGVGALGKWVWQYLTKRLQPQLYMVFTASILVIFLLTTTVFTALLLKNMQDETLTRLETDVKVLSYGLESRKSQVASDVAILVQQDGFADLVKNADRIGLANSVGKFILSKSLSSLVVVDSKGQVLARGEDRERIGDSISADSLITKALLGQSQVSVEVKEGALAPAVVVRSVVPVQSGGEIVGAAAGGTVIDNAFVDGIKQATGLEAAVYGGDVLTATTQTAADGKSRWVGIKILDKKIVSAVLKRGDNFSGEQNILNTPYFVSYLPLKDVDEAVVGMLFIGRPQVTVLTTVSKSVELTFVSTAILMMLAIVPAYFISKFMAQQLS